MGSGHYVAEASYLKVNQVAPQNDLTCASVCIWLMVWTLFSSAVMMSICFSLHCSLTELFCMVALVVTYPLVCTSSACSVKYVICVHCRWWSLVFSFRAQQNQLMSLSELFILQSMHICGRFSLGSIWNTGTVSCFMCHPGRCGVPASGCYHRLYLHFSPWLRGEQWREVWYVLW